jgi:small GTP-binding protein
VVDDQAIKYQIWDTAGQEKYHSLAPMYYRGAAAAIVTYDITRKNTFQTVKNWIKELKTLGPENIVIAIAGNKADLGDQRAVEIQSAQEYADEIGAIFTETSAKTDSKVSDLFVDISRHLPKEQTPGHSAQSSITVVSASGGGKKKKGGCCG